MAKSNAATAKPLKARAAKNIIKESILDEQNAEAKLRSLLSGLKRMRKGDFSVRLPANSSGLFYEVADTFNDVAEMNAKMTHEFNRISQIVGREGKISQRAQLPFAQGDWKDCLDSMNGLIGDLVYPTSEIARVISSVAKGDLSPTMATDVEGRPVKGEFLRIAKMVNTMMDQLNAFSSEVNRMVREVGSEGKLGGQAEVKGVAGTWKDLTDNVNLMARNLTSQVRNIAEVTTAVASGDLSKKITVDVKGEILELKDTINTMVDQLNSFASEVTRVSREVGLEGKLGGQALVKGVAGAWKDLTDNVNLMAGNLTSQVRNIADVTTAVASGDLSKKITVNVKGEILELKNTINTMVDQLNSFASEVTRVSREVGLEGKLGGQAQVKGVAGAWKDLTDNVNLMAGNLTSQVRNIAEVTTAVAKGDLSKKITVDVKGEILELKDTVNTMVDQLNSFASEVSRVAREVGSEGKLGGQAEVKGVAGTWKDLTDSVNLMAGNLTNQVRNIAEVSTAVASGDLSKKITVDVKGEILELKNTINTMVDQLNSFASEVTRVAREVGSEGKLGGQAQVKGVGGTWKDLTDNVNLMAGNLTNQVRNIAEVTTAVASGDLSKKITVDVKGEILELKNTVNTMVDQLNSFASEVTRVAREVGLEGKLGGQALVKGVAGAWKDLTDNVNLMAGNLTNQVRNIAEVTTAVAKGDLSKKITVDVKGEILELKNTVNTMVDQLNSFASEVTRVSREVGLEGKLGGQAQVKGVAGAWKDLTDNVNLMAGNLTNQVRNIAAVTTAVASGDLSKKITVDVKGEILELKNTINTMVDQLNSFASEVTRVSREVGLEGKLGGQAQVKGVAGAWKDLTDNVNLMAGNLTGQVRGIAKVVTGVAGGDLKRKLALEAKGEIAALAETINEMIDTLATFADQVTGVAREVGVEGKLGGQATVPGAAGLWRDLTDNVNQLAANLTTQVRAIADVATAVTKGDLTRSIAVEARGEVAALKDTINEMIRNLRDTTLKNNEQDWLKTNLAKFSRMLQGQRDILTVSKMILSELAAVVSAQHGVFYLTEGERENQILRLVGSFAYRERSNLSNSFKLGEGVVGQCALEKERILLTNVPYEYVKINSGLGEAKPLSIIVLPVIYEGNVKAVIELASFQNYSEVQLMFLDQLMESIGIVLNTISASMRTEDLLKKSQSLTQDLQSQQDKLQNTNAELEEKAKLLSEQKTEVEKKNREVELTKRALEEKAEQLSLTSKYKSEFLANMSHELRTPLNSLLILAKMLMENQQGNLSGKQVEFAHTIHSSGTELLALISEILDLSKIEAGKMGVEIAEIAFPEIRSQIARNFQQLAQAKGLKFKIELGGELPPSMTTDGKRLHQVIKNLLSNAFKFTERGEVALSIDIATEGWSPGHKTLNSAEKVIAFTVTDTGIGIPRDKQQLIFEAFQQADGTTSRRYGGTGLGLTISREISVLLGGEIAVSSTPNKGSQFTFYLPQKFIKRKPIRTERPELKLLPTAVREDEPLDTSLLSDTTLQASEVPSVLETEIDDDRESIVAGDKVILIADDDATFSRVLLEVARQNGFKGIISLSGATVIGLARRFRPAAITLDIKMPDVEGWALLDRLKHDLQTRHIPVYIISGRKGRRRALKAGAVGFFEKPVEQDRLKLLFTEVNEFIRREKRKLLIIEDDETQSNSMAELIGGTDVEITRVSSGADAMKYFHENRPDCVVLDLGLPDMTGFDLLKQMEAAELYHVPVIVYTGKEITSQQEIELSRYANSIIVKGVSSPERLLEETARFLHRMESKFPEENLKLLRQAQLSDPILRGKKVLIVDDDVRNIYALVSLLEGYQMKTCFAENGRDGIKMLQETPGIDVILMDVMMPEMDGYETTTAIRQIDEFKNLPVIAVTAKAMKSDRDKCIQAGSDDYIAKPVEPEELLSLLRVYLNKDRHETIEQSGTA